MDNKPTNKNQLMHDILDTNNLNLDSYLFRFTSKKHLSESEDIIEVHANPNPVEMVINHYEGGHNMMAKEIGEGLAFATDIHSDFESEHKVCVKVKIKDIIDQGGSVFQVVSVPEYIKAFFFSIPKGKVEVSYKV